MVDQNNEPQAVQVNNIAENDAALTNELEELRKKYVSKIILMIVLVILSFLGMMIFPLISFVLIILIFIVAIKYLNPAQKQFKSAYKNRVVLNAFNKIFTNVSYDYETGIPYETIAKTQMMRMGDTYHSNDHLKGKYKDISFESADVHIEQESTDSDGDTTYITLFKGQWFIFDFNKTFKADLQVCQKSFRNAKRKNGIFTKKEEKFQKVELEDIEFNKVFNVYAQNSVEAFYILTPNTMQKIKELDNQIKGSLLFCFINNKLHVAINSYKDLFEANPFKRVNLQEAEQQILSEMTNITQFVDILNLDNSLFKQ